MQTNRLGRSAVCVTELSFGAAGIGNLYAPVSDATARGGGRAAWEAGIRCFDTAPHYGLGLSEQRLGAALRDYPREAYVVSTKVGRILEPVQHPDGDDLANGFAVPASHRRRWDFTADGVSAPWPRACAASAWTGSTSSTCTTPTSTPSRRCARRTRPWRSCGTRA